MNFLKFKKTSYFLFGLSLFFLPTQNHYLSLPLVWQPSLVIEAGAELPWPASYPVNYTGRKAPALTAVSALVVDHDSAVILFQKNPGVRLFPASTVKIMTALVALDHYQLDEILTVENLDADGQVIELQAGEKISVRALLYALLVASANDAAQVLAQNYPGGETAFVRAMNQKAKTLNLNDSYFANPSGLDYDQFDQLLPDHSLATTRDLARLTVQALRNPVFASIVATPQILITDVTGQIIHPLRNINQLLGQIRGLKGVKTGWTEEAGECLVSYVERSGKGVVLVVLGSDDRFGETARLVNWIFANHEWERLTPAIGDQ